MISPFIYHMAMRRMTRGCLKADDGDIERFRFFVAPPRQPKR